ncbi:MAG: class I SAM-dependent rRNA methyltransferase [Planctomycetota bacterium]
MLNRVILKPGREKSVKYRHPWIFSGAIARIEGDAQDGDVVGVCDAGDALLARGLINRNSQIIVRLVSWRMEERITDDFFRARLDDAINARASIVESGTTNALRLVYSEADGLPGLIVDRYGDCLVLQIGALGLEQRRELIVNHLLERLKPRAIVYRAEDEYREKEGLTLPSAVIVGELPPDGVDLEEHGIRYRVDLMAGQKTGFYLDQRDNRRRIQGLCAGAVVLDVFSHSGAFALSALKGGAQLVTQIESSAAAIEFARRNFELNGYGALAQDILCENAFESLRRFRDSGRSFDVILVDPPKLAPSRTHLDSALRAYKDINLLAIKLLKPGGRLVTFSCSGAVTAELFQEMLFHAALDARRDVQIIERLEQASDHPVLVTFPESRYLKGVVCRVGR